MALNSMKYFVATTLILILTSCVSQNYPFAVSERACAFTPEQREIAWSNVTSALIERYPEHSEYCEIDAPAASKLFEVVGGECRVYLACAESVDGRSLLHGDWIVSINEATQEVIEFYDVAW